MRLMYLEPYEVLEDHILMDLVGKPVTVKTDKIGIVTKAWVEDRWVMADLELGVVTDHGNII